MLVVENTPDVHNVTVCTRVLLPWPGAGSAAGVVQISALSFAYRHRPARRSRQFRLPENKEIRVWDSSAELRAYLVLPNVGGQGRWKQRIARFGWRRWLP